MLQLGYPQVRTVFPRAVCGMGFFFFFFLITPLLSTPLVTMLFRAPLTHVHLPPRGSDGPWVLMVCFFFFPLFLFLASPHTFGLFLGTLRRLPLPPLFCSGTARHKVFFEPLPPLLAMRELTASVFFPSSSPDYVGCSVSLGGVFVTPGKGQKQRGCGPH